MIKNEKHFMVELLAAVLKNQSPGSFISGCDWADVYSEAMRHSVAGMVCYGLEKLSEENQPAEDLKLQFKQAKFKGIAKEAAQHVTVINLLKEFDNEGIRVLPLKEFVVKYAYPMPDMRSVDNVTILIDTINKAAAKRILVDKGFFSTKAQSNLTIYTYNSFTRLEVYDGILPGQNTFGSYFNHIFDRSILKEGYRYVYAMVPENFYLHLVACMREDYLQHDTDIRSIMDLWVYRRFSKETADWDMIDKELEIMGLKDFEERCMGLAMSWFDSSRKDVASDEIISL